jgi:hypothetical protein
LDPCICHFSKIFHFSTKKNLGDLGVTQTSESKPCGLMRHKKKAKPGTTPQCGNTALNGSTAGLLDLENLTRSSQDTQLRCISVQPPCNNIKGNLKVRDVSIGPVICTYSNQCLKALSPSLDLSWPVSEVTTSPHILQFRSDAAEVA